MTRKHFIEVSKVLNESVKDQAVRAELYARLARIFQENPRFDRTAWFQASLDEMRHGLDK